MDSVQLATPLPAIDSEQLSQIHKHPKFNPNPRRSKYNKLWWHNEDFTKANHKQYAMLCYQGHSALFGGRPFGGKMQRVSNKVLTPFGWTEIGKLKLGSKVCATDGTVTDVIGIYPQGVVDLYRVTMRDGGSTECGLDHNWLAWRTHHGAKKGNVIYRGPEGARKYTTRQIIEEMAKGRKCDGRLRSFVIPVTQPVALNVAGQLKGRSNFIARPIDPYFLGVLIGDGSIASPQTSVTSMDEQIALFLASMAGEDFGVHQKRDNQAKSFRFRGEFRARLWRQLTDLGLAGSRSESKHIPRQYLMAPTESRWSLFQGLMDTDGWPEEGRAIYYTTISERLRDDVVFLARSLGGITSVTEKNPTYTSRGKKLRGRKAYCVRIRIADPTRCFRLDRKRKIAATIEHQCEGRIIESIEPSGRDEAVCIQVAHQNSLYITDDFIVTHNSAYALMRALQYMDIPGYSALILRRTWPQLSKSGGLIPLSHQWLQEFTKDGSMKWNEQKRLWTSREGGLLQFGHVENENDKFNFQGDSYALLIFDEVTQFSLSIYEFISTRLRRSTALMDNGVPLQIQCTANPGGEGNDWVREMFIENSNEDCIFMSSSMEDNKFGDHVTYRKQLERTTDVVLREQLLAGNWYVMPEGDCFKKEWFGPDIYVEDYPPNMVYVRAWDTAAMRKDRKQESDYTVGVLMGKSRQNVFYIIDVVRFQGTMGTVDAIQRKTAQDDQDTYGLVQQVEEQQPSSSGKNEIERKRGGTFLGFWFSSVPSVRMTGNKMVRARGLASAMQGERVKIVKDPKWNKPFESELLCFPAGSRDDQVDAASLAFTSLIKRKEQRLIHSELHLIGGNTSF